MDDRRFDDLARSLAAGSVSRRRALRGLAGGLLAGVLAHVGLEEAAAACIAPGSRSRCTRHTQCCSRRCNRQKRRCLPCKTGTTYCQATQRCIPSGSCCTSTDCTGGKECKNGACVCPEGWGDCEGLGTCGPMGQDNNHCGACNNRCTGGRFCKDGTCVCDRTVQCGPECACSGGKTCQNGACACPEGWGDCAGLGVCGPMDQDNNHCGACNNQCTGGRFCKDGDCVCDNRVQCGPDCGCTGGKECKDGACVCPEGSADCEGRGTCGPLNADNNHCGACNNRCTGGKVCKNGTCVCDAAVRCGPECACSGGKTCRDGACVCDAGTCGPECLCPIGKTCVDGRCECDGVRCNAECGCGEGDICSGGVCRPPL